MAQPKTEDLEIFVTVAESQSFTLAANFHNTQVAKISRAIARLENMLNVTLFNRTTRKIDLTEDGQTFLTYAKQSLAILSEGTAALSVNKCSPRGPLRVDAASPFMFHQIIPWVKAFKQAYPQIQLELITHENIVDLIEKKTDVAIRIGRLSDSNLYAKKLGTSPLRIVASPEYLDECGTPKSSQELSVHTLIGFAEAPKLNNWPLKEPARIKPSLFASNGESVRQLTLAGNGLSLLSNFMVNDDLRSGRLVEVLPHALQTPNPREEIHAVYYKNSSVSARINAFIDFFSPRLTL